MCKKYCKLIHEEDRKTDIIFGINRFINTVDRQNCKMKEWLSIANLKYGNNAEKLSFNNAQEIEIFPNDL